MIGGVNAAHMGVMTTLAPNRQKAGIPTGGEFAPRNRTDSAVGLGNGYASVPVPTEDQYNRAESEARRQLAWTSESVGTPAELDDRIDAIALRFAEQEAGWTAYQNGQPHPDDAHFAAIWDGLAPGFSESIVAYDLQQSRALRDALDNGTIDGDTIATAGMGNAGSDSAAARQFINERIQAYALAMECGGRNLSVNQAAALAARRLSEVQPPF